MHLHSDSYQFAATIMEQHFATEAAELRLAIESLNVEECLNPSGPYNPDSRPMVPKAHMRNIGGHDALVPLPISQKEMNKRLKKLLAPLGWQKEPVVDEDDVMDTKTRLRGDFYKNRVFVEVEFGNVASFYRDVLKFHLAHRSQKGDIGALITATYKTALLFDDGVVQFEGVQALKPYLRFGTQMPVWIVGIEPDDFAPVRARYEEMQKVLEGNDRLVHSWDSVMGALEEGVARAAEEFSEDLDD